jgi:Outer membrane protein beta-barrel domain
MKITKLFVFCAVLLVGLAAWSQDFPRAEVAADYSYARFYPVARGTQSLSLNGGGGALVVNVTKYFGIKMDLQGYGSNTVTWTNPAGGSATAQGNLFTYMFGPQIKFRTPKFQPFAQWLLGAAHSNVYGNLTKACAGSCTTSGTPANNAFAMAMGGGIDIPINKNFQFRPVEIDYLMTRFTNQFNNSSQNNFRYSAGVNFTFGGSSSK